MSLIMTTTKMYSAEFLVNNKKYWESILRERFQYSQEEVLNMNKNEIWHMLVIHKVPCAN